MAFTVGRVRAMVAMALVLSACGCAAAGSTHDAHTGGQDALGRDISTLTISMDDLEWYPMTLPNKMPGGRSVVLKGNLQQPRPFTLLTYTPPHYEIPAHWHDADEEIVVLSGSVYMGGGDGKPMNKSNGPLYKRGDRHHLPATTVHWLITGDEPAVLKISSAGPFGMHWVGQ